MKIAIIVHLELDPMPGVIHSPESAVGDVQRILSDHIGHYNPTVEMGLVFDQPHDNKGTV